MLVIFAASNRNIYKMSKKTIILLFMQLLFALNAKAQTGPDSAFVGKIINDELKIYLVMNFVEKNVTVPQQEVFGEVDGYMGCKDTAHVWTIVSSEIKGRTVYIGMINNYGSEDITASVTLEKDGTYTYKHISGSTLKFPVGQKWYKIPTKVSFKKAGK